MANDLNQWQGIGRLTKDPEIRHTGSGDQVANFSIACGWKSKEKEGVEFINCVVFGKLAEICGQYLKKGSQVYISGAMKTRKWQDKTTGADRYSTEINVNQMQMLGGKQEGQAAPAGNTAAKSGGFDEDFDSSIPF